MKKSPFKSGLMATTTFFGAVLSVAAVPALVAGLSLVAPTTAMAQGLTAGSLAGTVKTDAGDAASGATVSIRGASGGYSATATTDSSGRFRFSSLPTGEYDVEITAADGSKTSSSVSVTLGGTSNFDFTVASGSTTVVVKGKARRNLDFDRTTTGQVVDVQATADRLPVGRSIEAIADLVPGISINDVFGPPSVAGASPAENIYYVNGMNVTNFRNFLGGTTVPFDFYDQVEVKTGGYQAEFGRSTGGAFIATTRRGTNKFKGGVSFYYEPGDLASSADPVRVDNEGTDKQYKTDYASYEVKESNFWLSGPIIKDHAHFFLFYNPRDFQRTDDTYENGRLIERASEKDDDPFYGMKLDFALNSDHRLEYTYFYDNTAGNTRNIGSTNTDDIGGLTRIAKYTGKFSDFFTLSAMYGRSTYHQNSYSDVDNQAAVLQGGIIVRGNQDLVVESGNDRRENFRIDGDFYFDLYGKHHVRAGWDQEKLTASALTQYSGGVYYRYYAANTNCGGYGVQATCVRVRRLFGGGEFDIENTGFFIQDDWAVTDRLNLSLGVRNDKFDNKNARGKSFLLSEDQIAPRLGLSYDLHGDKTTKLTAFYGRYYLPIAGNTNIRLAGGEDFTQAFHTYTAINPTTLVPVLGPQIALEVLSDGTIPDADTLVSQNIEPQYQDEYILGYEKRLDNGWSLSATYMYRKLGAVMEDVDADYTPACAYLVSQGLVANAGACGSFGGSGYVLMNPGSDLVIKLGDSWGALDGRTVTIPAANLDLPKAEREYEAFTLAFARPYDGDWSLGGSLTISKSIGNIEGGVKSDNGQDDTGLTQDFDEPGWMDGSYGLLPNHHAFSLKLNGVKNINERLRAGFVATMLSPRKYGCIGYYPFADGRASGSTLTSWYCDGELTPRGKSFSGDWINKVDVSLAYKMPITFGDIEMRADVFNIFNFQGAEQYTEQGEIGGSGTLANNYGLPSAYQQPRYVRLSLKYSF